MPAGTFYFTGKAALTDQLETLADKHIYERGKNVFPYSENEALLFVDFVPELSAGQTADIYLNGTVATTVKVVDSTGLIYAPLKLPFGSNQVRVHVGSTEITNPNKQLRNHFFITKNYIIFIEKLIIIFDRIKAELEAIKNDTFYDTIRDDRLEEIFGSKLKFPHFNNLSLELYRNALVGVNNTDRPGLRGALFYQSTEAAINKIVKSILGTDPEFISLYDFHGWVLKGSRRYQLLNPSLFYDSITNPIVDTDPSNPHYFLEVAPPSNRLATIDFWQRKKGTIEIKITDADIEVIEESVIRNPNNQLFDLLANTNINYNKPITVTQGVTTYTYGVDFGLDFKAGKILWYVPTLGDNRVFDDSNTLVVNNFGDQVVVDDVNLLSGLKPADNTVYTVSYWYFPVDLLSFLFTRLKPAHIKIVLDLFDSLDNEYIVSAGVWDVSEWDNTYFG